MGGGPLRRAPRPRHLRQGRDQRLPTPGRRPRRGSGARGARGRPDVRVPPRAHLPGHPAARAALANLDAIEREGLEARALHIGSRLEPELRALEAAGTLTEVRGLAGIWGVTLPEGIDAFAVRDAMMRAGVIVRPLGPSVIGICPPLVIDDHDLDRCATALGEAVIAVRSGTTTP
ncbi:MAG: aminotransferase class III-fold pyridoxal phosphate-dependent enzyme [Acidimicrobiales bacterium]